MKINQIVTEHKKGVRAMKYTKKTKSTVPLYGPDKQEAKLTPVKPIKPVKTVSEDAPIGVVSAVSPDGKEVTIKKTDGSELKTTGSAVMPGPDGKTAQLAPQAGAGLKPGTPVTNSGTEGAVSEEGSEGESMTLPLDVVMKGVTDLAQSNKVDISADQLKPMLVLAPNGEVDAIKTLTKIAGYFQGPEFTGFINDMRKLVAWAEQNRPGPTKAAAAGNAPYNPLNKPESKLGTGTYDGMTDEDTVGPRFAGVQQTKHDDGSQTINYQAGPMDVTNKVDAQGRPVTSRSKYDLGVAKVDSELDHRSGIRSNAIDTPGMDPNELLPTSDIAAARGVDPKKFAKFQKQNPTAVKESPELTAMLQIAGLR